MDHHQGKRVHYYYYYVRLSTGVEVVSRGGSRHSSGEHVLYSVYRNRAMASTRATVVPRGRFVGKLLQNVPVG